MYVNSLWCILQFLFTFIFAFCLHRRDIFILIRGRKGPVKYCTCRMIKLNWCLSFDTSVMYNNGTTDSHKKNINNSPVYIVNLPFFQIYQILQSFFYIGPLMNIRCLSCFVYEHVKIRGYCIYARALDLILITKLRACSYQGFFYRSNRHEQTDYETY